MVLMNTDCCRFTVSWFLYILFQLVDFLTEELQPDDKVIVFVGKKAV